MRLTLIIAAFLLALQAGAPPAENDKDRGGPGATREAQKLPQEIQKPRTFRLEVPPDLHVAPGQRREVNIRLDAGVDFYQRVCLYFGAPEGVRVLPAHAEIQPGDKETTITIIGDRGLTAGDRTLQIMGEPETGKSVLLQVPLHVTEPK
jgi:hypothetical protein